jgi:hypothetical protein
MAQSAALLMIEAFFVREDTLKIVLVSLSRNKLPDKEIKKHHEWVKADMPSDGNFRSNIDWYRFGKLLLMQKHLLVFRAAKYLQITGAKYLLTESEFKTSAEAQTADERSVMSARD